MTDEELLKAQDFALEKRIKALENHKIFTMWTSVRQGGKTTLDAMLSLNRGIRNLTDMFHTQNNQLGEFSIKLGNLEKKLEGIGNGCSLAQQNLKEVNELKNRVENNLGINGIYNTRFTKLTEQIAELRKQIQNNAISDLNHYEVNENRINELKTKVKINASNLANLTTENSIKIGKIGNGYFKLEGVLWELIKKIEFWGKEKLLEKLDAPKEQTVNLGDLLREKGILPQKADVIIYEDPEAEKKDSNTKQVERIYNDGFKDGMRHSDEVHERIKASGGEKERVKKKISKIIKEKYEKLPEPIPKELKALMKNGDVRRYIKNQYIDGFNLGIKMQKSVEKKLIEEFLEDLKYAVNSYLEVNTATDKYIKILIEKWQGRVK